MLTALIFIALELLAIFILLAALLARLSQQGAALYRIIGIDSKFSAQQRAALFELTIALVGLTAKLARCTDETPSEIQAKLVLPALAKARALVKAPSDTGQEKSHG